MANSGFVYNNGSLVFPKTDLVPLPSGANSTQYVVASDWNTLNQAVTDCRSAILSGSLLGFTDQASRPSVTGASKFLWIKTSDNHLYYYNGTSDTDLSSGGGSSYSAGNGLTLTSTTFSIDTSITVDKTTSQALSSKTLTAPVIATGLTASGSASNDFSGSTGTFKTSTGASTFGGSTNTFSSGAIGPAAGQQHTLPAVSSDTLALLAATQSLAAKTLVSPVISTGLTASGSATNDFSGSSGTWKFSTGGLAGNFGIATDNSFGIGDVNHTLTGVATKHLIGGTSNTSGHIVPNVADDTIALLAATQTLTNKTIDTASNTFLRMPVLANVRVFSTGGNVASLSGAQTINGIACVAADRVCLTAQTTASENGLWVVQSSTWTRPTDFAAGSSAAGLVVFARLGTVQSGSHRICTSTPGSDVVGTNNLTFAQAALDLTIACDLSTVQTLVNKTLTSPVINGTVTTSGLTMPTFSMGSAKITSVLDPTSAQDVATKNYVDATAQGLSTKASARAVATSNQSTMIGVATIDGVVTIVGDRVLLTGQSTATQNGLWLISLTSWTRPSDFATGAHASGSYVFIEQGTSNKGSGWVCTNDETGDVIDTNNLTFTQFSGAGEITAGTGLSKSGNTLSIDTSVTVDTTTAQALSSKTLTAPVINGLTSSGSTAINFGSNSGAFTTSTGAVTVSGSSVSINTPSGNPLLVKSNGTTILTVDSTGDIILPATAGIIDSGSRGLLMGPGTTTTIFQSSAFNPYYTEGPSLGDATHHWNGAWSLSFYSKAQTPTFSTTMNIDPTLGEQINVTVTANLASWTMSNPGGPGQRFILRFTQSGGVWTYGTAPTSNVIWLPTAYMGTDQAVPTGKIGGNTGLTGTHIFIAVDSTHWQEISRTFTLSP